MKLLRILTGPHAGAQLRLDQGVYSIGAHEDADIQLGDWAAPGTTLCISAEAGAYLDTGATEEPRTALDDYTPVRFGETVLCLGEAHGPWPSDLTLLSGLLGASGAHTAPALAAPASPPAAPPRVRSRATVYVTALLSFIFFVLTAVAGMLVSSTQASRAAFPHTPQDRAARIDEALGVAQVGGITTLVVNHTVALRGIVRNETDDQTIRATLQRLGADEEVLKQYDIAQNDEHAIEDALGTAGVHVTYAGNGVFAVSGQVRDPQLIDAALQRVRGDLSGNVKDVLNRTTALPGAETSRGPDYSSLVASRDVQYAETPDGVKHIYAGGGPTAPAGRHDALGERAGAQQN